MSVVCSVSPSRRAFTLIELLVAVAIIGLIAACVIPYIMSIRETHRRVACENNLRHIRDALAAYQGDYNSYPRTRFNVDSAAWTAFTGPDDANPFAPGTQVAANDVTASLWLLVRTGIIADTRVFNCPSTAQTPDRLVDAAGQTVAKEQRSNFRSGDHLSYSFLSPFNISLGEGGWSDTLKPEVALLADRNPGVKGYRDDVTKPASGDAPELQAYANSNNHGKAGQVVLYASGYVGFVPTAYRGSGYAAASGKTKATPGDNIYTALRRLPIPTGEKPDADGNGFFDRNVGPSWPGDSYLIPSDDVE